ncbi:unnamed protein product [Effrenium voratum]|nr:unnamed protein product [Effrenium voratum]
MRSTPSSMRRSFLTPEVLGSTPSSSRGDRLEDEPTLSSSMSQASGGGSQEKSGPVAGALSTKKRQLYWTISDLDCRCPSRCPPMDWARALAQSDADLYARTTHIAQCRWPAALAALESFAPRRLEPSLVTYNACIKACDWHRALHLVAGLRCRSLRPDRFSQNTALASASASGAWRAAAEVLRAMGRAALRADRITFNSAICGHWTWAFCSLESIRLRNCEPNVVTHGAGLSAATQWLQAVAMLQEVQSVICCSAAISVCEQQAEWQAPLRLLECMGLDRLSPNLVTFSAAISSCEKGRRWTKATELLAELRASGVQEDLLPQNAAIFACAKGHWQLSVALLDHSRAFARTVATYNSAAAAFEDSWQETLQLMGLLRRRSLRIDVITCTATATACDKVVKWQLNLHLLRALDVPADMMTLNSAMSACARGQCWITATQILGEMNTLRLEPDIVSCNAAITSYGQRPRAALQIFSEALSRRLQPSEITCNALLGALASGAYWSEALRMYRRLGDFQLESGVLTYEATIAACAAGQQHQAMILLLESMQGKSLAFLT